MLIGAAALLSPAWAKHTPGFAAKLHRTQELIRSSGDDPESLEPTIVGSNFAYPILSSLFERLTAINNLGQVAR